MWCVSWYLAAVYWQRVADLAVDCTVIWCPVEARVDAPLDAPVVGCDPEKLLAYVPAD